MLPAVFVRFFLLCVFRLKTPARLFAVLGVAQDPEAGEAGGAHTPTVTLPWAGDTPGEIGFIVAVPGDVRFCLYRLPANAAFRLLFDFISAGAE